MTATMTAESKELSDGNRRVLGGLEVMFEAVRLVHREDRQHRWYLYCDKGKFKFGAFVASNCSSAEIPEDGMASVASEAARHLANYKQVEFA